MSVTRAAVNTSTASGGVSAPMHRFATMTTPKCTRSMFAAFRIGTSSGTRITIEAIISIASPTNSRNTLSTSSSRIQLPASVAMRGGELLRHLLDDQRERKRRGRRDHHQHGRGLGHALAQRMQQRRAVRGAIDEHAAQHRIERRDRAGFGRREHAVADAADDDAPAAPAPAARI